MRAGEGSQEGRGGEAGKATVSNGENERPCEIGSTKVNKRTRGTCYVIPQILEDFEFGLFSKYRAGEQIIEVGSAKI